MARLIGTSVIVLFAVGLVAVNGGSLVTTGHTVATTIGTAGTATRSSSTWRSAPTGDRAGSGARPPGAGDMTGERVRVVRRATCPTPVSGVVAASDNGSGLESQGGDVA